MPEKEQVVEVLAVKETERQLSKKELKKKELAELEAVLAELGINKSETSGQEDSQGKLLLNLFYSLLDCGCMLICHMNEYSKYYLSVILNFYIVMLCCFFHSQGKERNSLIIPASLFEKEKWIFTRLYRTHTCIYIYMCVCIV